MRPVHEPPGADPHAGWCGEGRLETGPYPIVLKPNEDSIASSIFFAEQKNSYVTVCLIARIEQVWSKHHHSTEDAKHPKSQTAK